MLQVRGLQIQIEQTAAAATRVAGRTLSMESVRVPIAFWVLMESEPPQTGLDRLFGSVGTAELAGNVSSFRKVP